MLDLDLWKSILENLTTRRNLRTGRLLGERCRVVAGNEGGLLVTHTVKTFPRSPPFKEGKPSEERLWTRVKRTVAWSKSNPVTHYLARMLERSPRNIFIRMSSSRSVSPA